MRNPDEPANLDAGLALLGLLLSMAGATLWLFLGGFWPGGVLAALGAGCGQLAISRLDAGEQEISEQRGRTFASFAVGVGAAVAILSVAFSFL